MRRIVRQEILDAGTASPGEIRRSLRDLQFINRWFGGISTSKFLVHRVLERTKKQQLSILDVGAATGDGPDALQRTFKSTKFNFTLLDRIPAHFNGTGSRMNCVGGDALALPFRNGSFDIITCSLFAHHLEPEQIVAFTNEALRVSRIALFINDLRRSYVHLGLIYAGLPLFGRVTRHDSVASVLRSYTPAELKTMLERSRASSVEMHNTFLCRMGAIAWK
jgi:ubiquinone/menaquinone biosynthesis C-methylase UbiE